MKRSVKKVKTISGRGQSRPYARGVFGRVLLTFLLFGLVACGTLEIGLETTPMTSDNQGSGQGGIHDKQPASKEEVPATAFVAENAVVSTLEDTQQDPEEEVPATATVAEDSPVAPPTINILPAPVYFINAEDSQIWQVEVDGVSVTQITSEDTPVTDFDVSPKDGALVYISGNQLIYYTRALGGRRKVLIPDNEAFDENDYISAVTFGVSDPRWSPDGAQIVFGNGGINLYLDPAGPREAGIPEVWDVLGNDPLPVPLPEEGTVYEGAQIWYRPLSWLPDGKHVLINGAYYFALGRFKAILTTEDGSLVEVEEPQGLPCCFLAWGKDSQRLYYAGNQPGMFQTGLWQLDSSTGESTVLVPGEWGGEYHFFAYPFEASNDQVYGFYTREPASSGVMPFPPRPLVMVSVASDGSAELTQLRQDYLVVGEADWLPDGSGAVITDVAGREGGWPFDGPLRYLPSDGSPAVTLPAQGQRPQWGKAFHDD
jgi:dipeptidyl aminopeptidase/acylaminoacyl peptidase